jgi:L-proline amide hydrolase
MGDGKFWTVELFLSELDNLLSRLGIKSDYDLLGQSWGGILGAAHAINQPKELHRLVLADSPADMEMWVIAADKLRQELPPGIQSTLLQHEKDGTTDSPEYEAAMEVFYDRHVCRVKPTPKDFQDSMDAVKEDGTVYHTMFVSTTISNHLSCCLSPSLLFFLPCPHLSSPYSQIPRNGPSEFHITGTLKSFSLLPSLSKIIVPTLLLNGKYDEATDYVMEPFFQAIEKVKWVRFAESSHTPHLEETDEFLRILGGFLKAD